MQRRAASVQGTSHWCPKTASLAAPGGYIPGVKLEDAVCYKAVVASDTRFDGLFFVAISTTGIYCRPVCPARTARRSSCTFFPTAAAAERAGYRPCLRCRPELAPTRAPFDTRVDVVPGVIARIQAGALNNGAGVEGLADEFSLSARQIRRRLREEAGVSPVELAQTCRLLLAKQLLTETRLPVTRIAFASGFSSLRRFNQAFLSHYRMSPSRLRKESGAGGANGRLRLRLVYRAPFDWPALLSFLAPRTIEGVEQVTDGVYERTVAIGGHRGWLRVGPARRGPALTVELSSSLTPVLQPVLARLRDLFDLHARPDVIDAQLGESPPLADLVRRRPGLRVPGAFDGFELAWRAVLGQQVSVRGASTLAGRFAAAFGEPLDTPLVGLRLASPAPRRVARATVARIAKLALPRARAASVRAVSELVAREPKLLEPGRSVEATTEQLRALPGIGPWTAEYVAMRALRWPDAFPESDLGLKHALGERSPQRIRAIAEPWRPWRAYAAMHLWTSLGGGA